MLASKSIPAHLARGVLGLGSLWASVAFGQTQPWLMVISLPVALLALRGCPMCWTLGLAETVLAKLRGKQPSSACLDGSCALNGPSSRKRESSPTALRALQHAERHLRAPRHPDAHQR